MTPNEPIDGGLDPDERELARILRALPAAEPSAALDARILRAASAAAAAPAARRRRGIGLLGGGGALWGIGTAAAAVLALGIGWHSLYGDRAMLPASAPVAAPSADEDDSVSVEFRDHTSLADKAFPGPPPPPPAPVAKPLARNAPPAPAAAVAAPAPVPFPDSGLDEHVAARAEAGAAMDAAAAAPAPAAARERADVQGGLAANAAMADAREAALASQKAAAKQAARAADVASARMEQGFEPPRAPDANAARLRPATWLAQVRVLRDAGKTREARERLLEFRRQYPHWVIPTDLAPLLRE